MSKQCRIGSSPKCRRTQARRRVPLSRRAFLAALVVGIGVGCKTVIRPPNLRNIDGPSGGP